MNDEHVDPLESRVMADAEASIAHSRKRAPVPQGVVAATDAELDDLVAGHDVVLVEAWASWCAPCRTFAPVYEETARRFDGEALFLKIDVDANQDLPKRYGIQSIPTLLAFRRGRLVDQRAGAMPPAMFEEYVRALAGA